jgi:hypothetical protein
MAAPILVSILLKNPTNPEQKLDVFNRDIYCVGYENYKVPKCVHTVTYGHMTSCYWIVSKETLP